MATQRSVEVLFEPGQYEKLEKIARSKGQSVAELVKKAVEVEYLQPGPSAKRQAIERLLQLDLPTRSWEEVKETLIKERSREVEAP